MRSKRLYPVAGTPRLFSPQAPLAHCASSDWCNTLPAPHRQGQDVLQPSIGWYRIREASLVSACLLHIYFQLITSRVSKSIYWQVLLWGSQVQWLTSSTFFTEEDSGHPGPHLFGWLQCRSRSMKLSIRTVCQGLLTIPYVFQCRVCFWAWTRG